MIRAHTQPNEASVNIRQVSKSRQSTAVLFTYGMSTAFLLYPVENIIGSVQYLIGSAGMFMSMLLLMHQWPGKQLLNAVLIVAILARITAIFQFPAQSDIHRYIWEGEIQLSGYNPFLLAPDAAELESLRNANWQGINHKNIPAIYWPFAQMLFKAGAIISPSPLFFKTVMVLFDIGTLLLLLLFLRSFSADYREIVLYALNPLGIILIAGEGHLEIVMVFWIFLALYGYKRNKYWLMYPAIGLAIMTKVTPLLFLPLLIERRNLRYLPLVLLPFLLMVPYWDTTASFLSVPAFFVTHYEHNGFFNYIGQMLIGKIPAIWVAGCSAAFLSGVVFFITPDKIRAVFLVSAILLMFSPTFHPWYLLLITPFLVFYRSVPWIILHLTILLMVFYFNLSARQPFWHDLNLLQHIEYMPFIVSGIWCIGKKTSGRWPARFQTAESLSVIIPTCNEEKNIAACIQSVQHTETEAEIIVVDGGSTDRTRNISLMFAKVRLLTSLQGRGIQIRKGVMHARNDIIVILHADSRLLPGAVSRMLSALQANPSAIGGCFGAIYDDQKLRMRITEILNRLRVMISGISFGDQAQFFRRDAMGNRIPALMLMEDIELSLRMKEAGTIIFIPRGVTCSSRTWEKTGYFTNFLRVVDLTARYLVRRKFGMLTSDCADFYRKYYGR
jgi:hypothetical protein